MNQVNQSFYRPCMPGPQADNVPHFGSLGSQAQGGGYADDLNIVNSFTIHLY